MAQITHLDAIDPCDPRVGSYCNLTDAGLRALEAQGQLGRFIAEGPLVVREALLRSREETALGRPALVRSILIDSLALEAHREVLDLAPADLPVYAAPRHAVQHIVGFQFHRGILACGTRPADHDWRAISCDAAALVVLENLANHDNVGSIFRSVAALAGPKAAVLLSPGCCDPLYRKSLRVSIGHALRIRFARVEPWPAALAELAAMGFAPIALTPNPMAPAIAEVREGLPGRPLLLIGTEGPGLTQGAMHHPTVGLARIPMALGVDSLNAGVAAAIALSHLTRPT